MKNFSFLLFGLMMAVVFSSCQKLDYVEPSSDNSGISLKMAGALVVGDTITVQMRTMCTFKVETAFTATSMQVEFEGGSSIVPLNSYFEQSWTETGLTWLTITAIDQNNQPHVKTYQVKVQASLQEPVVFVSVAPVSGTNFFDVRIALSKNGLPLGPGVIAYTGSVTNPPWSTVYFLAADTNYRLEANNLIPATGSQVGNWLGLPLQLLPGNYELGVGRMNAGNLIWGDFMGSSFVGAGNSTLIKFTLTVNGEIISGANTLLMPGNIGDIGDNPVVRFSENTDGSWILYVNNSVDFYSMPHPFVKFLSENGIWNTPINQSAVTDFPNWGKIVLSTPIPEMLQYQFGSNNQAPDYVNSNMSYSEHWNAQTGTLETMLVSSVVNSPSPGGTTYEWVPANTNSR
ncbi:hypothetical protein K9M09_01165 [Patescibacteria group bacterium]|nr:hypothetical protein [Patescibacteria group bacterium]